MSFVPVIRSLEASPLIQELALQVEKQPAIHLNGLSRLAKGLVTSTLAQQNQSNLLVVCATQEEAGRWTVQLEAMGWDTVHFYPTSEASPYHPFDPEAEMIWGSLQILADLQKVNPSRAIIATETALQTHLPPPEVFTQACLTLTKGISWDSRKLDQKLVELGYQRVSLVETEGQWSRRGDILDIFPVASELPLRLEWIGDELEQIREFDPANQRSLDQLDDCFLTPTSFSPLIWSHLKEEQRVALAESGEGYPEGLGRYLGVSFAQPASLLDYLAPGTMIAIDELDQCQLRCDRNLTEWEEQLQEGRPTVRIHRPFQACVEAIQDFKTLYLCELVVENQEGFNFSTRPLPTTPHQFAKLGEIIRGKKEIYDNIQLSQYAIWLISAQPMRSVSLLQEHDCNISFVPNPKDYPTINKLLTQRIPIALKYSGLAELQGFVCPNLRLAIITDREFFGQHSLASNVGYVRKRRRAASKQVDLNQLHPGDYVVHKTHGIGKFLKLDSLANREYVVIEYGDGVLRVPVDSMDVLSRYRHHGTTPPTLHRMSSKAWSQTKNRVRKAVKKLALDLLQLYAQRSSVKGYAYQPDQPWQLELEDSFPYQVTPDQLKAIQDVKQDLESDRPMDRLVCGDVGFGKTEVAIRAIFKVVSTSSRQVAFLAPTTVLTQQHYHTLKERFAPYPINVALLNRFRTSSERQDILNRLKTGDIDVIVGTHQLLGKVVEFKDLGLLVVDEEQRFGVNQKEKIKALKTQVDVLTLSATPIPRTLYMSLSGMREMSLITTPPPSRRPIKTHLSAYNPEVVRNAIRNELDRGGQIFYVVPRVEGIEGIGAQLQQMVPGVRVVIAHGQMAEADLEATMLTFSNGQADLLLCTTIIESGLDIPRVNTIIIEESHRFGLSQLYQLRGRVGRSGIQAHAWLLYVKENLSPQARQRLRAIQEFAQLGSGYQLAVRDMEIRGVGSLLGAEQSGQMEAIGFDLYMEMLQEAIKEIQGQEIPQVEDTQIDLAVTAFIPADYIPDLDQKLDAYRSVASANSPEDLAQIKSDLSDRYGPVPFPVEQLLQVMTLKQVAKSLGFSRIRPEGRQHLILETPMEEPAWKLLAENLPIHLQTRFVYAPKKVIVRGLGMVKAQTQLENLIDWLGKMRKSLTNK